MTEDTSSGIRVNLDYDDLLAATVQVWEIQENRQPDLPPYVTGENCEICGRGVPRWEFVRIARRTCCALCDDPDDDGCDYNVSRSAGGEIICQQCGSQVWACTPQITSCPTCSPQLWRDVEAAGPSIARIIALVEARS
jgi:hypothetical protein